MKTNRHDVKYGVTDLGQAAALVCVGFEIVNLTPNRDSNRVTFYFKPYTNFEYTAQKYWSGELQVDAKQFWQEMKNLKARLYSLK